MIIDGKDLILGRLASYAAKRALLGENVDVVNCEKIVISGDKVALFKRYKRRADMGTYKGPFIHRDPAKLVKRTIRGMLPYKQERGRKAFKKVKCYTGIPLELKDKTPETMEHAKISNSNIFKYAYVKDISKFLGGKI